MNFSQPLFVFAVLLIPSFKVLTDYFYVLLNVVGVVHCLNCTNFVTQLL